MSLQFNVPNMACSACSETITKAIRTIDPIAKINADLKTKLVDVDTLASAEEVGRAIVNAGYTIV